MYLLLLKLQLELRYTQVLVGWSLSESGGGGGDFCNLASVCNRIRQQLRLCAGFWAFAMLIGHPSPLFEPSFVYPPPRTGFSQLCVNGEFQVLVQTFEVIIFSLSVCFLQSVLVVVIAGDRRLMRDYVLPFPHRRILYLM